MKACSSETPVDFWVRNISESRRLHNHRCGDIKSYSRHRIRVSAKASLSETDGNLTISLQCTLYVTENYTEINQSFQISRFRNDLHPLLGLSVFVDN
jgi:hypothetical protein